MSIVKSSVLLAGLLELIPSCMFCVVFVSSVVVEWWGLKPCCVGDRGPVDTVAVKQLRACVQA